MDSDFNIIHLNEVDSTNNYALKLLNDYPTNICNTIITTNYQTAGKGAYNNKWISNKGENLLFSMIICPYLDAANQFIISKITSLSIISYLESYNISAKIKWPNDVVAENKKIAGILIENSVTGSKISETVIGIGININQENFNNELNATSLKNLTKQKYSIKEELNRFLDIFKKWKIYFSKKDYDFINQNYFLNLLGTNQFLKYKDKNGEFEAIIENIDEFGRLVIKLKNNEIRKYSFKQIELVHQQ